jgi:hypothetical protein
MISVNRGAGVFLASFMLASILASSLSAGRCQAADQLVPEVADAPIPAAPAGTMTPPPPPTADLPGSTSSIGSLATPEPKPSIPAVVAAPSPVVSEMAPPAPEANAPVSSPTPEASTKVEDVVVDVKQEEPDWPNINKKKYLEYHSHWGVQVDASPGALGRNLDLGGNDVDGNPINSQPWGVGIALEYEPEFFQQYGILSFGPTFNIYPSFSSNDDFPNAEAIWSIGAQIRYQFRYKEQQLLVPMVGLDYEKLTYHLVTEGTGSLDIIGPVFGLNILLNDLDPMNATAFYFDAGVLKTYLVFEGRLMEGDNGVLDVSGLSWFFGVRMEF